MKKLLQVGAFFLVISFASCKTYCPAYSSVQPHEKAEQATVTASSAPSAEAEADIKS
ncbi:hypothetical protein [Botryobacter ruber]|uniref:hypothetical protein n=1 Tax=Botryobacter ruber TaxID=2171629 RepID=UPI0013E409FF|nr:hypothetical protein [Botryobacter ruber]